MFLCFSIPLLKWDLSWGVSTNSSSSYIFHNRGQETHVSLINLALAFNLADQYIFLRKLDLYGIEYIVVKILFT